MDGLTHKEKMDLEQVFAAIYVKKQSRFIRFYREFYALSKGLMRIRFKRIYKTRLK